MFFKKKRTIKLKGITLTRINKKILNKLFVGQIVYVNVDIDTDIYSIETYNNERIGNVSSKDKEYAEKYNYAIIRNITDTNIELCIICENIFCIRLKIQMLLKLDNGTALVIKKINQSYYLFDDKNINVGKIIDQRINEELLSNIAVSQYENEKLLNIVYK